MRTVILSLMALMAAAALGPTWGSPSEAAAKRAEVLVLGVYHMANPGIKIIIQVCMGIKMQNI